MLQPKRVATAFLLLLAPFAALAHPGHADGSPVLHQAVHSLHYLVALAAICIWVAQSADRVRRIKANGRKRKNDSSGD